MDRLVVHELIQSELTVMNLKKELQDLLNNPTRREELKRDYAELKQILSEAEPGSHKSASAKAAASIHDTIKKN
jgi:lipid A disaccharide synthetase